MHRRNEANSAEEGAHFHYCSGPGDLKSLEASFNFQSGGLRYRLLKRMEVQSRTTLDRLIRERRQLSNAIAQLPASSKGELNKRVIDIVGQAQFDSETLIEIVERISSALSRSGRAG